MLPNLKKDADGGITLYVQHDSPGAESDPNRLPAPAGPFFVAMRLYWPTTEVLDGSWTTSSVAPVSGQAAERLRLNYTSDSALGLLCTRKRLHHYLGLGGNAAAEVPRP